MMSNSPNLPLSSETGLTGVMHLKRYWHRQHAYKSGALPTSSFTEEWDTDNILFSLLGLGIKQSLQKIFIDDLNFEEFEQWVLQLHNGHIDAKLIERINGIVMHDGNNNHRVTITGDDVLSSSDLLHWHAQGFVILRNAVTTTDCEAAIAAITEFLAIDLKDPSTWYKNHRGKEGVMVQLFQHPALDRNRQSLKIRRAFEQLWQRNDIIVNMDKAGFNPPEKINWKFPGTRLHWDVSLHLPIPFGTQGILYLSDTIAEQGALTVVPGFQNKIEDWIKNLPADADPREQDLSVLGPIPIAANAGDFIIWHHALPHSGSPNLTDKPRFVQYINYAPAFTERHSKWV